MMMTTQGASVDTSTDLQKTRAFAIEAARVMADRKCEDVRVLGVHGISQVCDFIVIGSGTSDRQMKSVASELKDLGREHDHEIFRSNADDNATWIINDFVNVVVHLFEPNLRAYYDLESMWSDAAPVHWQRNGSANGDVGRNDDDDDDDEHETG